MQLTIENGLTATSSYKSKLNELIKNTFGFSFAKFHDLGVWGKDYECYSLIENDTMVANISVFHHKLLVDKQIVDCLQLGAVATKQEYRRRGLSRRLMDEIFDRFPSTPAFLFAGHDVAQFYPKFGFRPLPDNQPYMVYTINNPGELRKVHPQEPCIAGYLGNRRQYSSLDCVNQSMINWFHLCYNYADHTYHIPELDALVVMVQEDQVLKLVDVVSCEPIHFEELLPYLRFEGVEAIEFGFGPERLSVDSNVGTRPIDDSILFVRGYIRPERAFVPLTIRT